MIEDGYEYRGDLIKMFLGKENKIKAFLAKTGAIPQNMLATVFRQQVSARRRIIFSLKFFAVRCIEPSAENVLGGRDQTGADVSWVISSAQS